MEPRIFRVLSHDAVMFEVEFFWVVMPCSVVIGVTIQKTST